MTYMSLRAGVFITCARNSRTADSSSTSAATSAGVSAKSQKAWVRIGLGTVFGSSLASAGEQTAPFCVGRNRTVLNA